MCHSRAVLFVVTLELYCSPDRKTTDPDSLCILRLNTSVLTVLPILVPRDHKVPNSVDKVSHQCIGCPGSWVHHGRNYMVGHILVE